MKKKIVCAFAVIAGAAALAVAQTDIVAITSSTVKLILSESLHCETLVEGDGFDEGFYIADKPKFVNHSFVVPKGRKGRVCVSYDLR